MTEYALFIWARGAFPRRLVYYLLEKGLVASPAALLAGETTHPNLKLNLQTVSLENGVFSASDSDPSDPKPSGMSTPCLRVRDDGKESWVHESTSIMMLFEEAFDSGPSLASKDPVMRAMTWDMLGQINLTGVDITYYLRHASPVTQSWTHMDPNQRSHPAARNARDAFDRGLVKLQTWAEPSLKNSGWLTPGVQGPGVVDFALAGPSRYQLLGYELDCFEDERLGLLREWWARFEKLSWWGEFEECEDNHPEGMSYPKEVREV
jgi:glutathione S-transferase